ncbi:hypothetical protein NXH67_13670 [Butyrivibrio sp. DSM 10294]|uniref:hypothetical protein n=1 Tax=Butyrivibrio sp. DSM 10294 TaxID=2972457 RepID=UPI00234EDD48|nr:hypothetical protein [Butyrivibrio sp. DSM 10294]MDC7294561.1 hypothetical protein [Butyrivibrio sp. DSM 10294]
MRSKLFGRLMSFTLSATVALTSGIPALAYDGGGGDLPEEDVELLEEEVVEEDLEETGADFDVLEDEIVEDDEEFFAIEDEEAEFESYNDASFTIPNAHSLAHVGAYTIAADLATRISNHVDGGGSATQRFDSTKDFVFYVAPDMGYNWATTPSPVTPVSVAGGYTYKDEEAYTLEKGTDYKIEDSDISYASYLNNYDAVDWSLAKKVTIIGNSNIAKALAKYATTPTAFATAASLTFTMGTCAAAQYVQINTVYEDGLTRPAVDLAVAAYRPTYASPYNQSLAGLISSADEDKNVEVAVSLVKGDDVIEFDPEDSPDEQDEYKYATKTLTLPAVAVNYAYLMSKKGYKLTVTFSEGEEVAPDVITVAPTSTDYVTFAKVDSATMAAATKIPTTGAEITKGLERFGIYAYPTANTDTTRSILGVAYSVEGIAGTANAAVTTVRYPVNTGVGVYYKYGDHTDTGYNELDIDGDDKTHVQITNTQDDGGAFMVTPISPAVELNGNITLSAITGEQVVVKGGYDSANTASMINFTVGGIAKEINQTSEILASTKVSSTYSDSESGAITGKDYTFYVTPTAGYKVNDVKVDMYEKTGANSVSYTKAKGNLIVGDFGKYTVPAITGRLVITVTAVAESDSLKTIEVTGNTDDIALYRLSDKKPITTSADGFVAEGGSITFKAVPAAGKAIKAVSYAVNHGTATYTALTGTDDGEGGKNYTISNISDNITIKVESEAGFTFVKAPNPNVTLKVNGVEIKDGAAIGGFPIGTEGIAITVEGKGGAEVSNLWYAYATTVPDYDEVGDVVGVPTLTHTVGDEEVPGGKLGVTQLTNAAAVLNAKDYEYYLYAQTERNAPAASYTATFTKSGVAKAISSLDLLAGGVGLGVNATTITEDYAATANMEYADLAVAFKRSDYVIVAPSTATNTEYSLVKTGDAAIAKFFPQENAGFNRIVTTKLASTGMMSDTITAKETVSDADNGWLDQVVYTATLPLNVYPMSTMYAGGIELLSTVASASNTIEDMVGSDKTVIRTYKSGAFNDSATLTIIPYNINSETGKKVALTALQSTNVGEKQKIASVKWETTPAYASTQTESARQLYVHVPGEVDGESPTTNEDIIISQVKKPGTINVKATVTYVDGSKETATLDLSAVDQTFGYAAVAVVTRGGKTYIASDNESFTLEKKTGGINTATVKYRVFERLTSDGFVRALSGIAALAAEAKSDVTEAIIDEYLASEANIYVKEVTATFDGCDDEDKFDAVTAANSGSTYTITASQVGNSDRVTALGEVNGIPVAVPYFDVSVVNTLPTTTMTMALGDSDGAGTEYSKPQLKTTAAILGYAHSNNGSDKQGEITGFVFDKLTVGDVIVLPTISDFDLTTVYPKNTLTSWKVDNSGDSVADVYLAPGAKYTVKAGDTITAQWQPKYNGITVYNDLTDAAIKDKDFIGIGLSIPLSLRYKEIDWDKTPASANGAVTYKTDVTTAKTGFTVTPADETSTALTISGTTVTGAMANGGAVVNYKWVDGEAEYTGAEIAVADTDELADTGSTSFTVAEAIAYKLEMDAITVEEGQTKAFTAYYYPADGTKKDDSLNFNAGAIASVSAELKSGEAGNVEIESVSHSSTQNTIKVTGLKAGTSDTMTLAIVSKQGEKKTIEVPIRVTSTKKQIVLKTVNGKEVTTEDIQIPVANNAEAEATIITTNVTFNYVFDGSVQQAGAAEKWSISKVDDPDDLDDAAVADTQNGTILVSGSTVTVPIKTNENTFGTGKVKVTYTVDSTTGETFSAWFDVNTYYSLTFKAQVGTETTGNVYLVKNNGVTVKDSTAGDIVEKIVYNGENTYTVANAAKYTAVYATGDVANTAGNKNGAANTKKFLGWGNTEPHYTDATVSTTNFYEADAAITLKVVGGTAETAWPFTVNKENINLYAQFGANPVTSIEGLPSEIVLSDANIGTTTAISTASNALTDYLPISLTQNPADTEATIAVYADDIGLFTITDGEIPSRTIVKDATASESVGQALWGINGAPTASRFITMAVNGTISKVGAITIAKAANVAGKSAIHVVSGDLEYDIPVYVNGEYTDNDVKRYMENGEIVEEGARVVAGKTHYYKDSKQVLNDIVTITVDGVKKLVMVEAGVQVTTPANNTRAFNGKTYYIDADGYLGTGLIEIGGKTYLFREDGSKVFHTDSDVVDGKITAAGAEYVIADDDTAELADVRYAPTVKFSEWPSSWKKDTTYPAITYTVSYTSAKENKVVADPATYTAIVTAEPASIAADTVKVTFTATTNLTGFFADKEGTKVAEDVTTSKTYLFFDESGDSEEAIEISDEDSGIMIVGLNETYDYTGKAIKPRFYVYDSADELRPLALTTDYTIIYANNKNVGTADITIKGKGNYQGKSLTAHFQIVDPRAELTADELAELGEVKTLKISKDEHIFNGEAHYPSSIFLTLVGGSAVEYKLQEDGSYATASGEPIPAVVTVSNNVNKGSATITVRGKNNSKGKVTSKSKNFTIKAATLAAGKDGKDLEVEVEDAEWAVKGATPTITATWNGMPLIQGEDFTAKYVYAKNKLGAASVKITGKGNFKGKVDNAASFTIKALDLDSEGVSIASTNAIAGLAVKKLKVTVLDKAGNIIPAKLYKVSVLDESGNAFTGTFEGEKTYTIVVDRKDSNVAELGEDAISAAITTGINFSKVKIKVTSKYTRFYSGSPVVYETPEEIEEFNSKIAVTLGSETLKLGEDFEITGYTNNIKKGTMTVSLSGIGKYSGTKNVKIKIAAKKLTK